MEGDKGEGGCGFVGHKASGRWEFGCAHNLVVGRDDQWPPRPLRNGDARGEHESFDLSRMMPPRWNIAIAGPTVPHGEMFRELALIESDRAGAALGLLWRDIPAKHDGKLSGPKRLTLDEFIPIGDGVLASR